MWILGGRDQRVLHQDESRRRPGRLMNTERDYDAEMRDNKQRQYAYAFDFDVMHPFMIRSFRPFFSPGNLLELGSFKGDFTGRLQPYFADVTCVEASDAALAEARQRLKGGIQFVNSTFEAANLPRRYDHIVMTHVL